MAGIGNPDDRLTRMGERTTGVPKAAPMRGIRHVVATALALLAMPAAEAGAGAVRCARACRTAVAVCVDTGGRKATCRTALRDTCRRRGVTACNPGVATTTTTTSTSTTTIPIGDAGLWCYEAALVTCVSGFGCPASESGVLDLQIDGADVHGRISLDRCSYLPTEVTGHRDPGQLELHWEECGPYPGVPCFFTDSLQLSATGDGDVRALMVEAGHGGGSPLAAWSAQYAGTLHRCSDLAIDADGDGSRASCDECEEDPHKVAPGVCGCGVPDADADGERIVDCFVDSELQHRLDVLNSLVLALRRQGGTSRGEVRRQLAELEAFVDAERARITLPAGRDLTSLAATAAWRVVRATTTRSKRDVRMASRAIEAWRSLVPSDAPGEP